MRENAANLQDGGDGGTKGGPRQCDFEPSGGIAGEPSGVIADARLALIVDRWEGLPEATRARIVADKPPVALQFLALTKH